MQHLMNPLFSLCAIYTRRCQCSLFTAALLKSLSSLSADTNVLGTRNVLQVARELKQLECMVYVSTATGNCYRDVVKEIVHPPPFNLDEYFSAIESKKPKIINAFLKKVKPYFPNQYTLSKVVAENLCLLENARIPIAIVRPPIIAPSAVSPVPGWTYKMQTFNSLTLLYSIGLAKVLFWDPKIAVQAIPVDYASNAIIVAPWYMVNLAKNSKIEVFNSVIEKENEINWNDLVEWTRESVETLPSIKCLRRPATKLINPKTPCRFIFSIIFQHLLFALFADLIMTCTCQKPK